ncbi:retinal-binding protein, partial [Caerostris extrusa]
LDKPVTKVVQVFNLENLTFANATHTKTLLNLLYYIKQYLDNYPERLKYAIVLNASIIAMMSIPILKAILPTSMMQKIRIYGREGWREALLDLIDADELPAFLGGNRTDPDGNPLCETLLIHGQPIPKKYILFNDNKTTSTISEADRMTVSRLSKSWINVEVKESDLYLEWEFETKKKDIEFVIYYREQTSEESKQVELFPKQRIEACFEPEKGLYKCDKLGTYSILFDNSYSWIYPKDIYYKIKLRGSHEIEHELM